MTNDCQKIKILNKPFISNLCFDEKKSLHVVIRIEMKSEMINIY